MSDRSNRLLDPAIGYPPGWTPAGPATPRGTLSGPRGRWTIGVAVVVAVALATALSLAWHSRQPDNGGAGGGAAESSVAERNSGPGSADDRGPVSIITADATCSEWSEVRGPVVAAEKGGWARRDATRPRQQWDPVRSRQFDAMGAALKTAADQTAVLAGQTPHRVMRELYGAFTSYGREYAASLPSYQPSNDLLALTAMAAFDAVTNVCAAADGSSWVILRAQVVPQVADPTAQTPVGNVDRPARFLAQPAATCDTWISGHSALLAQTKSWSTVDADVPRDEWDASQRAAVERTAHVGALHADDMEAWGRDAGNPVFEDLAVLGAQYFRAYDLGVPTYRPGDNAFAHVGFDVSGLIAAACRASRT